MTVIHLPHTRCFTSTHPPLLLMLKQNQQQSLLHIAAQVRRLAGRYPDCLSMKFALNSREREAVDWALAEYTRRFGVRGEEDPDLFIHLGDNPRNFLCWSATSGKLPTYRTGSGLFWNPHRELWLLPRDKLSSLGLPVTETMAKAMKVPGLPMVDGARASSVVGNSFHFCTVAIVHMVALSCYTYSRVDTGLLDDSDDSMTC